MKQNSPLRIVMIYAILAGVYIIFSDQLIFRLNGAPQLVEKLSTYKGLAFIALTSIILYVLMSNAWNKRAQMERELNRQHRAIRALSEVNHAITWTANEEVLLQRTCQAIVEIGGYRLAWVGYALQDPAKTVQPVAFAGEAADYVAGLKVTWADDEHGRGPTGLAIRSRQPVIIQDLSQAANFGPWRQAARAHGLASSIALPLIAEGQTLGALSIYSAEAQAFDEAEVALLAELAADLSYGLQALRTRAAHDQAVQSLSQTEAYYRQLFISNPHPMWVYDLETLAFLEVNDAAVAHYGYTRQEFLNMTIKDIRPAEDIPRLPENITQLGKGLDRAGIWRHVKKDGSIIDVGITSHGVEFEQHRAEMVLIYDVTERLRAEQALRESEEKFRAVFEAANVGKSITTPEGLLFVNKAFAEMLGYTQEELAHTTWQMLTPKEDIEEVETLLAPLLNGEKDAVRFSKRYIHKNGSYIWGDISVAIRRDAEGKPLHFITTVVDITERKRAEQALRESEERYFNILNVAPVGIAVHQRGKIVFANPAGVQLISAASQDALVGRDISSIIHPDHLETAMNRIQRMLAGEQGLYPVEDKYVRLDGQVIDVEVMATRLTYQGEPAVQVIVTDITERKRAEQTLQESEERYRQLFEAESDAIFLIDNESGRILEANQSAANLYGYSRAELLALRNSDLSAEPQETQQVTQTTPVIQDQIVLIPLRMHKKKDGTVFPVEITGRFFVWRGRPVHIAAIRDITERMRVERQLNEQIAELRRWHAAMLGREGRILELKREVNALLRQIGQPPRYPSAEEENA